MAPILIEFGIGLLFAEEKNGLCSLFVSAKGKKNQFQGGK
jgi:hypothetical protein